MGELITKEIAPMSERAIKRFWKRVAVAAHDECWNWTSFCNEQGYGKLTHNKIQTQAHRIAYFLANGPIPSEIPVIRHKCDNPSCCNPAHLIAGTIKDNVKDRNGRGRQAMGEMCARRKLTRRDVEEIRRAYIPYTVTLKSLGKKYGVTLDQIHRVVRRKSWRGTA